MSVSLIEKNQLQKAREEIRLATLAPEKEQLAAMMNQWQQAESDAQCIEKLAKQYVPIIRSSPDKNKGIAALIQHYNLSCEEGVLLMCLAEALLRIPDKATEFQLIKDKLSQGNWQDDNTASKLVSASSFGLDLSSKLLKSGNNYISSLCKKVMRKLGRPIIVKAVYKAMEMLSSHFVLGTDIHDAMNHAEPLSHKGYLFSFDMLGEVARTQKDADKYFEAYKQALTAIVADSHKAGCFDNPGLSIKLSALHPRFEATHRHECVPVLIDRVNSLAQLAAQKGIQIAIDAEEADRTDMTLDVFESVYQNPALENWSGLCLVVQAYSKRASAILHWVECLIGKAGKTIPIRLVKGAYWDTEIKNAQDQGLSSYPVFTNKAATDISYLLCVKQLLGMGKKVYPQFATHNAATIAAVMHFFKDRSQESYELQLLQGMGHGLHDHLLKEKKVRCRIYAPVGRHEDLLPYLVRRLLENGANNSFVNRITDEKIPLEALIENPLVTLNNKYQEEKTLPLPADIFNSIRKNSPGLDLSFMPHSQSLKANWLELAKKKYSAVAAGSLKSLDYPIGSPFNHKNIVGTAYKTSPENIPGLIANANSAFEKWQYVSVQERSDILQKTADLLIENRNELVFLIVHEGGRTVQDALDEWREAVDFCRYYAGLALKELSPQNLPLR